MELGRIGAWRWIVVAISIAVCAGLAAIGLIGGGNRAERFEAKQVTVWPAGGDGVRIREIVDQDFGAQQRRGYQRIIPNDFGAPSDVTAESPDAPDDVSVVPLGSDTRIRIGDPDVTITGQHRYVLEYTLPDARIGSGELALDVIGTDEELRTGRFEVVVTGFELADPTCNVGRFGDVGGCALERDTSVDGGALYRAVISPLEPGDGITIGGTITGTTDVVEPAPPPLPERRPDRRLALALAMLPLGVASSGLVFWRIRRAGRNEVFAGGAAEAAYGALPRPGAGGDPDAGRPIELVPDDRMDDLATIEFVPPKGLDPWEGQVLLEEHVDDSTVSAWFSQMIAEEAITIDESGKRPVLRPGPRVTAVGGDAAGHLATLFSRGDEVELGTYDPAFARFWSGIRQHQMARIRAAGWWKRLPASAGPGGGAWIIGMLVLLVFFGGSAAFGALLGLAASLPVALLLGLVLPAIAAFVVFHSMLAVRSATGSALALRTESFRRFLDQSESRHVEWAWQHGLLREYSAWAVALGEADAWRRALDRAAVPEAERHTVTSPLLVASLASSFASARTQPSSSGGGGGGFSGGSVGGGGGGGSSGSW